MKDRIIDGVLLTLLVVMIYALIYALSQKERNYETWKLTRAEAQYILEESTKRGIGDCDLTPTSYGWDCVDKKTGEVYKIKKQNNLIARR
jgi:regulatory protein YycH of two-component signal transduction system YycFG